MNEVTQKKISPIDLIQKLFQRLFNNPKFVLIYFGLPILHLGVSVLVIKWINPMLGVYFSLLAFPVSFFSFYVMIQFLKDEPYSFKGYLKFYKIKTWLYLKVLIFYTPLILGGFFLFIIPGLILMSWTVYAYMAILFEDNAHKLNLTALGKELMKQNISYNLSLLFVVCILFFPIIIYFNFLLETELFGTLKFFLINSSKMIILMLFQALYCYSYIYLKEANVFNIEDYKDEAKPHLKHVCVSFLLLIISSFIIVLILFDHFN